MEEGFENQTQITNECDLDLKRGRVVGLGWSGLAAGSLGSARSLCDWVGLAWVHAPWQTRLIVSF